MTNDKVLSLFAAKFPLTVTLCQFNTHNNGTVSS